MWGKVTCGSLGLSTATVKLTDADGKEHVACSVGTGPVDAAYKAVDLIVQVLELEFYLVHQIEVGSTINCEIDLERLITCLLNDSVMPSK